MSRIFSIVLLSISLTLIGCTPVNNISEKELKSEGENEISPHAESSPRVTVIDNNDDFTYLEEFSEYELEKYSLFLTDGNTEHLKDFTPEQIVLTFMNLVLEHNVEKIYALTYDDGNLPLLDVFKDEYDEYLSPYLQDDYLKFRFYDSVSVDEDTREEDALAVQLKITFGGSTQILVYGLKKDQNVWKMELYHLVETKKGKV